MILEKHLADGNDFALLKPDAGSGDHSQGARRSQERRGGLVAVPLAADDGHGGFAGASPVDSRGCRRRGPSMRRHRAPSGQVPFGRSHCHQPGSGFACLCGSGKLRFRSSFHHPVSARSWPRASGGHSPPRLIRSAIARRRKISVAENPLNRRSHARASAVEENRAVMKKSGIAPATNRAQAA